MLHLARQLLPLMRDLVVLRVVGDDAELVDRGENERQQALEIANAHSAQHLERSFAGLAKLVEEVGQSAHPQLVLEMGLVRLADRPPLEPLSELLTRLSALEQRLGGGGGGGGSSAGRGGDPGGGTRGARRPQGPIAHELRDARSRGGVLPEPQPQLQPTPSLSPSPSPNPSPNPITSPSPSPNPSPVPSPTTTTSTSTAATPALDSDQAWRDIIATLQAEQPALAAVLEHGAPVEVTRDKLVISFPQGSFFGRQAGSTPAKQALLEAAQRVFGQRPRIEIGFGLSSDRPTVAAQEENKRKARRDELEQAARNHPRVKEALDVFPEVEGQFEVKVED
jgi:DNA polymerase-3 subunit gamma/tau